MSDSFRFFRKLLSIRTIVYPLVFIMGLLVGTGLFVQSSVGNRVLVPMRQKRWREGLCPRWKYRLVNCKHWDGNGVQLNNVSISPVGESALSFRSMTIDWNIEVGVRILVFCVLEDPIVVVSSNDAGELNWNRLLPASDTQDSSTVGIASVGT